MPTRRSYRFLSHNFNRDSRLRTTFTALRRPRAKVCRRNFDTGQCRRGYLLSLRRTHLAGQRRRTVSSAQDRRRRRRVTTPPVRSRSIQWTVMLDCDRILTELLLSRLLTS